MTAALGEGVAPSAPHLGRRPATEGMAGSIRLDTLKPGTHAITLHVYSSTTLQREAQTVIVTLP